MRYPSPARARPKPKPEKGPRNSPRGFWMRTWWRRCRRIGSRWPGWREGDEAMEAATTEEEDGGGEGKGVPEKTIECVRKKIYEYLLAHVEKIDDWLDTIGRRREGDEVTEAATAEEEDGGGEGKGVPEKTIERLRKKIYEYFLAHVEKIYDWLDTIGRRREGDEATEAATAEQEDENAE